MPQAQLYAHFCLCVWVEVIRVEHDHRKREDVRDVAVFLPVAFRTFDPTAVIRTLRRDTFFADIAFLGEAAEDVGVAIAVPSCERFHDAVNMLRLGRKRRRAQEDAEGDVECETLERKELQEGAERFCEERFRARAWMCESAWGLALADAKVPSIPCREDLREFAAWYRLVIFSDIG